jgi:hypothetical protein
MFRLKKGGYNMNELTMIIKILTKIEQLNVLNRFQPTIHLSLCFDETVKQYRCNLYNSNDGKLLNLLTFQEVELELDKMINYFHFLEDLPDSNSYYEDEFTTINSIKNTLK